MSLAARDGKPRPIDLPHPPGEAFAVVRACADSRITARKLGGIIQHDPVLSAEMLRIVNSPFFGFGGRIKSVPHAITLLGQRSLRNIALCVALRDMVRKDALSGFPLEAFWQASLWRAVCARVIAAETGYPEDEAFTFGLLQDFGYLMLFWLHRKRIPEAVRLQGLDPARRLDEERALFGQTHDQLARQLVEAWGLPEELAIPIGHHHAPLFDGLDESLALACRIAACADWMATVFTGSERHAALSRARACASERLGLTDAVFDRLMEAAVDAYREAGRAMSIPTGNARVSWDEILREANLLLAEDNLSFQEQTWRLEQALSERDRMAEELNRELSLAREVQCSLLPDRVGDLEMVAGCNVSARQVSGDFYDYFLTHDGQIQFAIADVSGKGMNAALLMAKTSSLFHCLGKAVTNPAMLAGMLNRELVEKSIRGMFVTMILGVLEPRSGTVTLVNAGHLPALQLGGGGAERRFPAHGPPLGIVPEVKYTAETFTLRDGPLYLFTDGVTEAEVMGRELGIDGLVSLLRMVQSDPLERRLHAVLERVRPREGSPRDDLTLMVIDWHAGRERTGDATEDTRRGGSTAAHA